MSKDARRAYMAILAQVEALAQEIEDISEIVPAVDSTETAKRLRLIVLNSKTK